MTPKRRITPLRIPGPERRLYSVNDCYSAGFMQAATGEKLNKGPRYVNKKAADDQFSQGFLDAVNIGAATGFDV